MVHLQNLTPFGGEIPSLVTSQYSHIRQQADYVQERIIAARALHRKLTLDIQKTGKKLLAAKDNNGSKELIGSLKRAVVKLRNRMNRCARDLSVFEEQLAVISAHMQDLEQRQFRHNSVPHLHYSRSEPAGHATGAPHDLQLWSAPLASSRGHLNVFEGNIDFPQLPQGLFESAFNNRPQTPMLRPVQFPPMGFTHPFPQRAPPQPEMDISPTGTFYTWDLDSPRGFPATNRLDIVAGVNGLQIMGGQSSTMNPGTAGSALQRTGRDFSQLPSMLDHQSAALRLQRAAAAKGDRWRSRC